MHYRLTRVLAAVAALLALASSVLGDSDRWYSVEMLGSKCGSSHIVVTTKDGLVTTDSSMKFGIQRGADDNGINISVVTTFIETEAGKPVSMKAVKVMARSPITESYTFNEDGTITLVSEEDGRKTTKQFPKPEGVWLTPNAAEKYIKQRYDSGAKEITVRSIDPTEGAVPVTATYSGFETTKLKIDGREIDSVKRAVVVQTGSTKVKSVEYVDTEGALVKSKMNLGGLSVDLNLTTKDAAAKREPMPEIMVSTFVKPDKPINDPRHAKRTVLLLSVPDDTMPALPTTGSQKAQIVNPASARLTITAAAALPAPAADATNVATLHATALCNTEDEKIKSLAARAVAKAAETPEAKAEACRRFVFNYIKKKNLSVGFASASEVAKTREGDCTEHGVLLAALLRANGIHARCAIGLVYADEFAGEKGIFGYHMWAQALLTVNGKPTWVDLDAVLSTDTPFDATHITLDTTDLADGDASNGLASIASILGRVSIKVEQAE